jgi:hypothetical protein
MATIGHSLIGLSIGSIGRAEVRGRVLQHVWPGLIVLMAHLVDLAEWAVILVAPGYFDQHFVTNSPLVTAGLVAAVWIVIAFVTRLRRPWLYVLVALAIGSHLLLDHRLVRTALADLYGGSSEEEMPGLYAAVVAEVWLYGLVLVMVALARAARQHDCPPRGRAAAAVLGVVALVAAVTRVPGLWMPAYGVAALHALLLLRRDLELRLLWSLAPLVPLAALLTVELWAGHLYHEARALQVNKDYAAAAKAYRQALAVPARSQKLGAHVRVSQCQREMGDFAAAEATLLRAVKMCDRPDWPHCVLAGLYADSRAKHTPLYRPEEAARILREVVDGLSPAMVKAHARRKLDRLHRRGLIE